MARRSNKWRPPELNWGHTDFQSVALPTELGRQMETIFNLFFGICQYLFRSGRSVGADSMQNKTRLTR